MPRQIEPCKESSLGGSYAQKMKPISTALPFAMIFFIAALSGCAGPIAYHDGKKLVEGGNIEEGLHQFQKAVEYDPRNVVYRQAYLQTRERAVYRFLLQADGLASSGKDDEAEKIYRRVLAIDPENQRAKAGLAAIAQHARHSGLLKEAQSAIDKKDSVSATQKLSTILAEDPHNEGAQAMRSSLDKKDAVPNDEAALAAVYKKPITIEFKDVPLKQILEVISRTAGLNFIFDKDVKSDQKTSVFLKKSTVEEAIRLTLLTNQLEQQVLNSNTLLIYPNTSAKQKDYQEMIVKSFFLANAEAKTVANTLKTITKTKDIVVDDKLNMLIVRDSPSAIKLAEKLIALQDVPEPEVMMEVEILEVNRTRLTDLGIQWPASLPLSPIPSATGATLTLNDLLHLNKTTISAGSPTVTINANGQNADANILANPRIRARNHEKAKIVIGERVPNISVTTSPFATNGFLSETINYVDVGLKLEVEPTIYLDNDVAIKVTLEVSSIVSQVQTKAGSIAYDIGTRNASTVLRLKDGENQVLAGLINDEDRKSVNQLPGLGSIPVLGRLFGNSNDNDLKTEIVLSITPHVVRNIQRPSAESSEFRSGTDSSFHVRSESGNIVPAAVISAAPPPAPDKGTASQNNNTPAANPINTPNTGTGVLPPPNTGNLNSGVNINGGALPGTGGPALGTSVPPADQPGSAAGGIAAIQWQGPTQAKVGDTITLQLQMQSSQPVSAIPVIIGFDNKTLQVANIVEGDFLRQGGIQTGFTSRIDPTGEIQLMDTRAEGGATASGTLASILFRVLAPADQAHVQILNAAPADPSGNQLPISYPSPFTLHVPPQ